MGAPRARANPDIASDIAPETAERNGVAALLDFAITEVLRENSAADALPAVLARLAGAFGARAVLAFQPSPVTVLAAHPGSFDDPALLAIIDRLPPAADTIRVPGGALVAYSAPVAGQCLCALALIGDESGWDEEVEAAAHTVATVVAAQIDHTSEVARLADQVELKEQLTEQNIALRQLDDARNQFVAMVSHELRTPLTSIVSFSELIRGEAEGLSPDGLHFLDIVERNADRLLRLIGDLLLLGRLEAGALPLDLAPVQLPDLATEAVRAASAIAARQDITVDVSTGTGPAVLADSRRLLQVLDNLIGNAVKFSHRHGSVHVTASWDGQHWRIDVADTGIGIPPGEAVRLFGRFVRASNARTAGLPGTGLGLSIVKVIVEMHGGHVEVTTALDQGTTFSVYLPVDLPAAP